MHHRRFQRPFKASAFYAPAFFALLIAIHDAASLECLSQAAASLTASNLFWRNAGYDHFYLHGLEYPVVTDFDYALGVGRPQEEAAEWLVQAFYATVQNMVIVATGELSQGTLFAALGGSLYGMRRVVTVPFVLIEDCMAETDEEPTRSVRLSFAGSVQPYNYERALFVRAAAAEFAGRLRKRAGGLIWTVDDPRLQLWAIVQLDPNLPALNTTQRNLFVARRRWLQQLYHRSELCVVAPGDAPVLGRRLSDAIAAGCVPVVLIGPGSQPVLPLQGPVRWEEFAILVHLGDDTTSARWALRRLLSMSQAELKRRRASPRRWRPRLALGQGPLCSDERELELRPDAGDLAVQEVLGLQAVWRRQLPTGSLELNTSACAAAVGASQEGIANSDMPGRCRAIRHLLPTWG
ncbi:unnamed protein product [Polarella glacialis]|uniref:Exostosin GT47 domain-containing protein n=1 Tax=Polarella glacialis TaxID=89957 RepID=A0A813LGG0_POLGL|nr:unnamed protein product [Polarella glacialis]